MSTERAIAPGGVGAELRAIVQDNYSLRRRLRAADGEIDRLRAVVVAQNSLILEQGLELEGRRAVMDLRDDLLENGHG